MVDQCGSRLEELETSGAPVTADGMLLLIVKMTSERAWRHGDEPYGVSVGLDVSNDVSNVLTRMLGTGIRNAQSLG